MPNSGNKPVSRALTLTVFSQEGPLLVHALRISHKFSDPTVSSFAPQPNPLVTAVYLETPTGNILLSDLEACKSFGIHRGAHVHVVKRRQSQELTFLDFTLLLTRAIHKSMASIIASNAVISMTTVRPMSHGDEGESDDE